MARHATGPQLKKNASGYYEIRWTEEGRSKRLSTGASEMVEAQTFLAGWLHEKGRDKARIPTVLEILETYEKERVQDRSPRQSSIIRNSLAKILGGIPLDGLSADRIKAYESARFSGERPAASGTVRRELGVLVAAINHAKRQLRIDPAVIPFISLPEGSPPRTETFTDAQLGQLAALVAPTTGQRASRICRFFWICRETASRRRAVETLKWSQVDFAARLIRFDDEGGKRVRKIKRRISSPISDELLPHLKRWHKERVSEWVLDDDGQAYVAWGALMSRAVKSTGDASFAMMVPHDLRRTWATLAARGGVSMFDIAGVLGDSPAVIIKHYAHQSPDHLRGAVNWRKAGKNSGAESGHNAPMGA